MVPCCRSTNVWLAARFAGSSCFFPSRASNCSASFLTAPSAAVLPDPGASMADPSSTMDSSSTVAGLAPASAFSDSSAFFPLRRRLERERERASASTASAAASSSSNVGSYPSSSAVLSLELDNERLGSLRLGSAASLHLLYGGLHSPELSLPLHESDERCLETLGLGAWYRQQPAPRWRQKETTRHPSSQIYSSTRAASSRLVVRSSNRYLETLSLGTRPPLAASRYVVCSA